MAQVAPLEIGPYQIFEEIGRGGMSVVYRARDTRDGRIVALKVLPQELHQQAQLLSRFVKEGQNALRLDHPNIVHTYEADLADNTYYIAMELVQGENLAEYLKRRQGPLPFNEAIQILRQVASGLDFAHSRGILHRDIKPSNILLNHDGRVQITDFGVARDLNAEHTLVTMPGHSIGTPAYMSPEQARGDQQVDNRSDIYSLGVVAYAMLTGKMPFEAGSHLSLLRKIIDDAPAPADVVNPQLHPGVARALRTVLAKEPQERYATAATFATALEAGMTEPPSAQSAPQVAVANPDATVVDLTGPATTNAPSTNATLSSGQPSRIRHGGNPLLVAAARARLRAKPSTPAKPIPRQFIIKTTSKQASRYFRTTNVKPSQAGAQVDNAGAQPVRRRRTTALVLGAALLMVVVLVAALLFDRFSSAPQAQSTAVALLASPQSAAPTSTPTQSSPPTATPAGPTESATESVSAAVVSDTATLSHTLTNTLTDTLSESSAEIVDTPTATEAAPEATATTAAVESPSAIRRLFPAPRATATPAPLPTNTPTEASPTSEPPASLPTATPTSAEVAIAATPQPTNTPKPAATSQPTATTSATALPPTNTATPQPLAPPAIATATPKAPTPTTVAGVDSTSAAPEAGATRTNEVDGALYAYVPAGKFSMGSTRQDDEKPLHVVDLAAFWIMQTEVTNAQYALCVAAGACTPPRNERFDDPAYADHPVVNLDWSQASAYAEWAGGRLPTEAEWEKAARGEDLRPFPWGETAPDATLLNFDSTVNDTTPVSNYPQGVSPYGLYDMAGNVEEWVADWYAGDYYAASPANNPLGPSEGIFRVVRGGSYRSAANLVLATTRGKAAPNRGYASVGFRVVLDP